MVSNCRLIEAELLNEKHDNERWRGLLQNVLARVARYERKVQMAMVITIS